MVGEEREWKERKRKRKGRPSIHNSGYDNASNWCTGKPRATEFTMFA